MDKINMEISAFAAEASNSKLVPYKYKVVNLGPDDIILDITHCGVCYSDVAFIDNHFGGTDYPLVAGHEVIGVVRQKGINVDHLDIGQRVGVGPQCGSCLNCQYCGSGRELLCGEKQLTIGEGNRGGFAESMIVNANFAFAIPDTLTSVNAAPLLCAGLTAYAPLARNTRPGMRAGIMGIGGLGHLAIQFAAKMGLEVTAISSSSSKEQEARRFGADDFITTDDREKLMSAAGSFDFILSTTYGEIDWPTYISLLKPDGHFCLVGASMGPIDMPAALLTVNQHHISGAAAGGRSDMMAMLDFAAKQGIQTQTEVMPMTEITDAINKVRSNDVRYRMVLTNL